MIFARFPPITTFPSKKLFVTTLPVATIVFLSITTPGKIIDPNPIKQLFAIFIFPKTSVASDITFIAELSWVINLTLTETVILSPNYSKYGSTEINGEKALLFLLTLTPLGS